MFCNNASGSDCVTARPLHRARAASAPRSPSGVSVRSEWLGRWRGRALSRRCSIPEQRPAPGYAPVRPTNFLTKQSFWGCVGLSATNGAERFGATPQNVLRNLQNLVVIQVRLWRPAKTNLEKVVSKEKDPVELENILC
ncbi:hypothetical protein EVAR_57786_1 [Eumeta japonica]|uniref:Uncharacterized protein n=1 Tax=Eumeta variegata TaxID=151549 RepID=A0A4C1Y523_EUMVA|nr:hypothetical protein EVAR_57786_1 [Eumeta japonica]